MLCRRFRRSHRVRMIYSTGWLFMICISSEGKYHFNPVVLDSCLHALVHPAFTRNLDKSVYYLPSSVQRVSLHKSFTQQKLPLTLYAYAELRQWDPGLHIFMPVFQSTHLPISIIWDLCITDEHGSRICTLTRLCLSLHQIK
jgi:hypothetical protein